MAESLLRKAGRDPSIVLPHRCAVFGSEVSDLFVGWLPCTKLQIYPFAFLVAPMILGHVLVKVIWWENVDGVGVVYNGDWEVRALKDMAGSK